LTQVADRGAADPSLFVDVLQNEHKSHVLQNERNSKND